MSYKRYDLSCEGRDFRFTYIARSRYDGDWHSMPHIHECAEVFCVVRGSGAIRVEDERLEVRPGDLMLINPRVKHTELSQQQDALEYIVMGIDGAQFFAPGRKEQRWFQPQDAQTRSDCRYYMEAILRECEGRQEGWPEVCAGLTQILMTLLVRQLNWQAPSMGRASAGSECARIRQYLDEHFAEALDLEALAEMGHMSKHYLVHSFTREFGQSPIHYLLERRIAQSRHLLENSDLTVSQISLSAGFSSLSYFSQRFKKAVGVTPLEYRRAMRAGKR